jgi:hypothetical protein
MESVGGGADEDASVGGLVYGNASSRGGYGDGDEVGATDLFGVLGRERAGGNAAFHAVSSIR